MPCFPPPPPTRIDDLLPTELPLIMGVGPCPLPARVAAANSIMLNHLGPMMNRIIESLQDKARYVFQTESRYVLGLAGPGSAAIEMAVTNLLWPGRRALILVNGSFSQRQATMAERVGAEVDTLVFEPGHAAAPEAVAKALASKKYDYLGMVQGETSCGVFNHHLPEIAAMGQAHGALVVVDTVVTLSTTPFEMDAWGVDVAITAGQKGLGSIPGVSLGVFGEKAWAQIEARETPPPHWVLDARLKTGFWLDHQYHYTAPTPGILALHEALAEICEETLEQRFARHQLHSSAMQAGIEALGLQLFVEGEARLLSAIAIRLPKSVDSARLRRGMEEDFGVQVAGAFGLPIFRIGQMGEQCRREPVLRTLGALGHTLSNQGWGTDPEAGVQAAAALLDQGGE